ACWRIPGSILPAQGGLLVRTGHRRSPRAWRELPALERVDKRARRVAVGRGAVGARDLIPPRSPLGDRVHARALPATDDDGAFLYHYGDFLSHLRPAFSSCLSDYCSY